MEILPNQTVILAKNRRLETERLILRPVTFADVYDMFEYASDEENTRFIFPTHQTLSDTEQSIATYFMASPLGKYGMELKDGGKLIGTIDLKINREHYTAEIGYALNKQYWGQGYTPEACQRLLRLGFEELSCIRISAVHNILNPNSGKVMEKVGMKQEGVIPNARKLKNIPVTDVIRGITKEEWEKRHAEI